MKRSGNLYHQIFEYENLVIACRKAMRGKQTRKAVLSFKEGFETNILDLQQQLRTGRIKAGDYRFFRIYDPKEREICAASFPERVLHHAIMNVCEPVLEKYAVFDSYACRKGKGLHRAIERARHFSGRFGWYLKMDVRKYFDSIDHLIALKDDMLLFGEDSQFLKKVLESSRKFLTDNLQLELKKPTQINRCSRGIPFLGFKIFPNVIRLSRRSKSRFVRKFRKYEQNRQAGIWSDTVLVRHMEPLVAFTRTADAAGFRRSLINRFGLPS
jgi:retron-type reverse transcriptase